MERFVLTCGSCQRNKAYTARARGIPNPLEAPDGRWQAVALDLVSLADSVEGYDTVVVFTDMFTKQIFCAPVRMKGTTAEKVAELFLLHVFRTQGLPKVLLSDCDAKFTSVFWGRLFELLGTGLKFSASYHQGCLRSRCLPCVTDNGLKYNIKPCIPVCLANDAGHIALHLPQSQKIIPTTSGRCSASLCLELTAQVDIKGEKGFFGNPD